MDDLVNRFRYHKPNEQKAELHHVVRTKCFQLATELNELLPEGREKALVMNKLEEVMFWSNAGLARNPIDEVDETRQIIKEELERIGKEERYK